MQVGQKLNLVLNQSRPTRFIRYLGKDISFSEATKYIGKLSYFVQNHVGHGQRVGVFMTACPHIYYSFFALAKSANMMVPLLWEHSDAEITQIVKTLDIKFFLVTRDLEKRALEIAEKESLDLTVVSVNQRRLGELDERYTLPPGQSMTDNSPVLFLPTEGYSGPPKWIPVTHGMIENQILSQRWAYKTSTADTFFAYKMNPLDAFPFLHCGIIPLLTGASLLISDQVEFSELFKDIVEARATRLISPLQHAYQLLKSFKELNMNWNWLRSVTPMRCRMSPVQEKYFKEHYEQTIILQNYGLAETGFASTMVPCEGPVLGRNQGKVLPGVTLRLLDVTGADISMKSGGIGEVVLAGKGQAHDYFKRPDEKKQTYRGASVFSGDIGKITKDGDFSWLGRTPTAPRYEDHFIDSLVVEEHIKSLPEVLDAVYIAVEDKLKKIKNVVVVYKSPQATLFTEQIMNICKSVVKTQELPSEIVFKTEWPVDRFGEANRARLASEIKGTF